MNNDPYQSPQPVDTMATTSQFSPTSLTIGLFGAAIGGAVGFFVYRWLLQQGLYGLAIPGGMLGLGFGLAARRSHWIYGAICLGLALGLSLFSEWATFPFVADKSLSFFLTHLHHLKPFTWIMIVVGCVVAYSCGSRWQS